MIESKFDTKIRDSSSLEHKPRVYFTCHPDDFSECFELIQNDIFRSHNCIIFYTRNMYEEIEERYYESDLDQMNLMVIPITFKLLNSPSRAMSFDFPYAKQKNIPILPIVMENTIDLDFKKAYDSNFGDLQYLERYIKDKTAINYKEKLKKYLDAVLISEDQVAKIREAFAAYVFLSYRKKDRHYANKLMRLIHSYQEYRDVAIWYDEFLTPGESFGENIKRMLTKSDLFALLVTPSILEYIDGRPNYVMEPEYPCAVEAELKILPVEMEETDKEDLRSKYIGIPDCVDPSDNEQLRTHLAKIFSNIAFSESKYDKEHNFLIGLAYLEGIDVEKNIDRALALITSSAEDGLPEAMEKLSMMYIEGKNVRIDCNKSVMWAERLLKYNEKTFGEGSCQVCDSMVFLAKAYGKSSRPDDAFKLSKRAYDLCCKLYRIDDEKTLAALGDLAYRYSKQKDYKAAIKLFEELYQLRVKKLGTDDPDTIRSLNNVASTYNKMGNSPKAYKLYQQVYELSCRVLGTTHYRTTRTLEKIKLLKKHLGTT